jgi:O-antigen/teichoic acid export membrane protein
MELPLNLLGNAISSVFTQKAIEVYNEDSSRLAKLCLDMFNKLFYLGLLPFGIITVFGDWIFKFAFGARWETAGMFTAYLGYYYVFKLASYATGPTYGVLQQQRLLLTGTVLLLIVRAASLFIGIHLHDLNLGMLLFGISSIIVTFGVDMNILHILKLNVWPIAARCIALMAATLGILWGLRLLIERIVN